ncbi:MAG: hypothetical protein AAFQ42_08570 [Pseudomonadota bacterium]
MYARKTAKFAVALLIAGTASASTAAADTEALAKRFALSTHDGAILLPDASLRRLAPRVGGASTSQAIDALRTFLTVNNVFLSQRQSSRDFAEAANLLFTNREKREIVRRFGVPNTLGANYYVKRFPFYISQHLNEFDQQEFADDVLKKLKARFGDTPIEGTFDAINIKRVALGRYDFSKGALRVNVLNGRAVELPRIRTSIDGRYGRGIAIPAARWANSVKAPRSVARQLREGTSRQRTVFLFTRGKLTVNRKGLTFEPQTFVLRERPTFGPSIRGLDLAGLYTSRGAAKRARAAKQAERERRVAERNQRAREQRLSKLKRSFAPRTLEVVGVRLGMTSQEAQAALRRNWPNAHFQRGKSNASAGSGLVVTTCGLLQSRFEQAFEPIERQARGLAALEGRPLSSAELRKLASERKRLQASWPKKCRVGPKIIEHAFVAQTGGSGGEPQDRINVFLSGADKRVVAVTRNYGGGSSGSQLLEGYKTKYGEETISRSRSDRFWFANERMHNVVAIDKKLQQECMARFPWPSSGDGFSIDGFKKACGQFIAVNANFLYLVDSDRLATSRSIAESETEPDNKPKLKL